MIVEYFQGMDKFDAQINIEVQWASELTIAAIEEKGGVITTRYYDPLSLLAVTCPLKYFQTGKPIPLCKMPPYDAVKYYGDANNRGYLADPAKVKQARLELAQKYGYELPDITKDPNYEMLSFRKDPRQIFMGLKPGWVVNLPNKVILQPEGELYKKFYNS